MAQPGEGLPRIGRPREEPVVLTLTKALTRESVQRLQQDVRDAPPHRLVIVDVTAVPSFDSDGTAELLGLQAEVGPDRLVVVGVRAAAARLVGSGDVLPAAVMVDSNAASSPQALRDALDAALAEDAAIVAVDLAAIPTPTVDVVAVLVTVSRRAALAGQEVVFLNVSDQAAAGLRRAGLAPTTFLAVTS